MLKATELKHMESVNTQKPYKLRIGQAKQNP